MTTDSSPLGDKIASLRAAPSGADGRMLSNALHTLIAAILARIFTRLEDIFLLWQAGTLPTPQPRHPRNRMSALPPLAGEAGTAAARAPHAAQPPGALHPWNHALPRISITRNAAASNAPLSSPPSSRSPPSPRLPVHLTRHETASTSAPRPPTPSHAPAPPRNSRPRRHPARAPPPLHPPDRHKPPQRGCMIAIISLRYRNLSSYTHSCALPDTYRQRYTNARYHPAKCSIISLTSRVVVRILPSRGMPPIKPEGV